MIIVLCSGWLSGGIRVQGGPWWRSSCELRKLFTVRDDLPNSGKRRIILDRESAEFFRLRSGLRPSLVDVRDFLDAINDPAVHPSDRVAVHCADLGRCSSGNSAHRLMSGAAGSHLGSREFLGIAKVRSIALPRCRDRTGRTPALDDVRMSCQGLPGPRRRLLRRLGPHVRLA